MRCPKCGEEADLVGLADENFPAAYRCNAHGEYNFSATGPEADEECRASAALSRSNARRYRKRNAR